MQARRLAKKICTIPMYNNQGDPGDGRRATGNGTDRRPQVTVTKITRYYSSEIGIGRTIQIGLPGRLLNNDLRHG